MSIIAKWKILRTIYSKLAEKDILRKSEKIQENEMSVILREIINMLEAMTDHFQFVHLLQIWNKWHCSAHRALSTHTGSTVSETETERQRLEWSRKSFSSHLGSAKLAKSYQIFPAAILFQFRLEIIVPYEA